MDCDLIPNVKKIAVLRALVLGDLIFILPALEALHHTYPDAEIVYLSRPWAADFIQGRIPGVSRVVTFRSSPYDYEDLGFLIHPEDAGWFFPQMRDEHFDIAFSMQGGGLNSNPFVQRLNPRVSIGSREQRAMALDRWLRHDYYQNDVIRNLDLARLAGVQPVSWTPHLRVLDADLRAAAPHLEEVRSPYTVIHAGARDIRRCWPPQKFAAVADFVRQELGMEVVLTGTAVDAHAAFEVENSTREPVHNFSHQLTLPALVGVLANSSLVISNDTGVLHLGLAVGAKAVGIYWGEYISKSMPLSRDCFYPVIAWERRCPECGMFLDRKEVVSADPRPCMHLVSFLNEISPEQVIRAVQSVLA